MTHNPFRLIVTASRGWRDPAPIDTYLDSQAALAARLMYPGLVVVHGDCRGGDKLAGGWAHNRRQRGWPISAEPWRAQWKKFGPAAGPIRNEAMVLSGADGCAAFIGPCTKPACAQPKPHPSHGASGCADLAESAGIRTERFYAADLDDWVKAQAVP